MPPAPGPVGPPAFWSGRPSPLSGRPSPSEPGGAPAPSPGRRSPLRPGRPPTLRSGRPPAVRLPSRPAGVRAGRSALSSAVRAAVSRSEDVPLTLRRLPRTERITPCRPRETGNAVGVRTRSARRRHGRRRQPRLRTPGFSRSRSHFRDRITADGRDGWPVEAGRYRLVVSPRLSVGEPGGDLASAAGAGGGAADGGGRSRPGRPQRGGSPWTRRAGTRCSASGS